MPSSPEDLEEARKYARAWAEPRYRQVAHGLDLWRRERAVFPERVERALDVGAGHGRLMAAWIEEGIDARGVDIVDGLDPAVRRAHGDRLVLAPLWNFEWGGEPFDVGVAADMLEHLPTARVEESLRRLAACCKVVVAQTAEFPSFFMGMKLHLTVQPAEWWRERMEQIGGEVEEFPHAGGRGAKHLLRWTLA